MDERNGPMSEVTEKNELAEVTETEPEVLPQPEKKRFRFMPDASVIRRIKITIIMILSVINITGIMIMIPGTPLHVRFFPVYRNPYEKTEVRFTGRNGEGTVILYHEPGDEFSGLNYTMNPSSGLYNGDKVIITAESVKGYRWSPAEAAVIVSGLADYVTDLSQVTEAGLLPIHYNTEIMIGLEWDRIKNEGGIQKYETKPVEILLFCKDLSGTEMNYLYDIYQTDVTKNDGTVMTVYEAFKYFALRTQRDGELTFRYGTLMNYNLGEKYGLGQDSSFSGWFELKLAEEDLQVLHRDYIYSSGS